MAFADQEQTCMTIEPSECNFSLNVISGENRVLRNWNILKRGRLRDLSGGCEKGVLWNAHTHTPLSGEYPPKQKKYEYPQNKALYL